MKRLHIYGTDQYNLPDRGGFVHEGKAYRPYAWTMYVNTVTGVATVEYTLAELVAIPMAIEDWSNMTLVKVSDSFVYRLPDGFAASWINECVVEELISSHFMGTLVNPIKGRERDLTFIMLPRIGTSQVLGTRRTYQLTEPQYPLEVATADLYVASGNVLIERNDFWNHPTIEMLVDYDVANYDWLVNNIMVPPEDTEE